MSPRRAGSKRAGSQALKRFHPRVREWFTETLGAPSDPQQKGWPAIASGDHTLILAPTGTGKTLSAFLWELNALITDGLESPLPNAVQLLYISPLKALNNDIQRNLEGPLAELQQRFSAAGERFPEIRVAVRTGDTPASARARMLRKSPHILITTPESLHIMLTSLRSRTMFHGVRAVIVDEIHAIAGTKRGAHLALTLERLEELCVTPPQRIGLSATQKPLEEIARFLGGCHPERSEGSARADSSQSLGRTFRPVTIVDCGLVRKEQLRAAASDRDEQMVVIAASDPANVWSIPFAASEDVEPESFARPRARRALLVTQAGRAILTADSRARSVNVRPGTSPDAVIDAVRALLKHVSARRSKDLTVESINFGPAAASPLSELFVRAGLRLTTSGLRHYASFDR